MAAIGEQREVVVKAQRLTPEAFAPYGRVVESDRQDLLMQEGKFTARLMTVQRAPETLDRINRHRDHSQMFVPLGGDPTVLIVAPPDVPVAGFDARRIAAFRTDGRQTVIFHPGTWHIEPRALGKDTCQVINVQTDVFRAHTDLLHLEQDCGVRVRLEVE